MKTLLVPPTNPKEGHVFYVHTKKPTASVGAIRGKLTKPLHYLYTSAHGKLTIDLLIRDVINANSGVIAEEGLTTLEISRNGKPLASLPDSVSVERLENVPVDLSINDDVEEAKDICRRNLSTLVRKLIVKLEAKHTVAGQYVRRGRLPLKKSQWKKISQSDETAALINTRVDARIQLADHTVSVPGILSDASAGEVLNYFAGNTLSVGNCFGTGNQPKSGTFAGVKWAEIWNENRTIIVGRATMSHILDGMLNLYSIAEGYHSRGWTIKLIE